MLNDAIKNIDFAEYMIIENVFICGLTAKGAFNYLEIRNMDYNDYKYLISLANQWLDQLYGDQTSG